MGTFSHIMNLFFLNNESIDYLKNEVSWQKIFGIFSLVQGIYLFILLIISLLFRSLVGDLGSTGFIIIGFVVLYLAIIVLFLFKACIVHVFLKLVGAKNNIDETIKFNLAIATAMTIISTGMFFVSLLPILGFLINIAFVFYGLYVSFHVYSRVHDISKLRVFLAYLLLILIFGVIFGIIAAVAFQAWYNTYQAENFAKLNEQTLYGSPITFEYLTEDKLYLENKNNYDIQARIDVGDCDDINSLLTSGLNEIDLSNANCQDMNQGSSKSIRVMTEDSVYSFIGSIN